MALYKKRTDVKNVDQQHTINSHRGLYSKEKKEPVRRKNRKLKPLFKKRKQDVVR